MANAFAQNIFPAGYRNLPPDLDTSSQAFVLFEQAGVFPAYRKAFIKEVSRWIDEQRPPEAISAHDRGWLARPGSTGAFLTWVEQPTPGRRNRIPAGNGENDVDSVVNLNVLSALALARRNGHALPPATAEAMRRAAALINGLVRRPEGDILPSTVWYDRTSQFYLAFAKAVANGADELQPACETVKTRLLHLGAQLADQFQVTNYLELAEALAALKLLEPDAQKRSPRVVTVMGKLEDRLAGGIAADGRVRTEDSMYPGTLYGFRFEWTSPAYSAAIALWALTAP